MNTMISAETQTPTVISLCEEPQAQPDAMPAKAIATSAVFFCQHRQGWWEKVDRFVYDNYEIAVERGGSRRYNGKRAIFEGPRITTLGTFDRSDLGWIMKAAKQHQTKAGMVPGGVRTPELVRMVIRGRRFVYEVGTGVMFKAA